MRRLRAGRILSFAASAATAAAMTLAPAMTRGEEAETRRVRVRVVEVAGRHAYLSPGSEAGMVRGAVARIKGRRFEVVEVTSSHSMVPLDEEGLRVGQRGVARVPVVDADHGVTRREPPRPLDAWRGAWAEPDVPALSQEPPHVPVGEILGPRRWNLGLSLGVGATLPDNGEPARLRGEARIRLHAEPLDSVPLGFDADVAAQLWLAEDLASRPGGRSRQYVRVRQLQVRYGDEQAFYAALGRLRYAATHVGTLDGARIQTPSLRGVTIGGFGGMVPNPLTGVPDIDTYRFGLELAYRNMGLSWRPAFTLVGQGSVFDGDLDERRVLFSALLFPGDGRVSAHAEVSFFDEDNPWQAAIAELSALGVDGSYRVSFFEIGARFDMQRPERSLWLDAYLPQSWLCTAVPDETGEGTDTCAGTDDTRYLASLDLGFRFPRWSIHAGSTATVFAEAPELTLVGGFLQGRVLRILGTGRGDVTFAVSYGEYLTRYSGRLGLGAAFWRQILDVSVFYRLAYSTFPADIEGWWSHLAGGRILVRPAASVDLSVNVEGMAGRDVNAAFLYGLVSWCPSF